MQIDRLREACRQRGITDEDFAWRFDAYLRAGTMRYEDRVAVHFLDPAGAAKYFLHRFGVDALPLAAIAYEEGVGGLAALLPEGSNSS
jgi:hypothetical protein